MNRRYACMLSQSRAFAAGLFARVGVSRFVNTALCGDFCCYGGYLIYDTACIGGLWSRCD